MIFEYCLYSLQTLLEYLLEVQSAELIICRLFCDNVGDIRNEFVKLYFNKLRTGEAGPCAVFQNIIDKDSKFKSTNIGKVFARRRSGRGDFKKNDTTNNNNNNKGNSNNKKGPKHQNNIGNLDASTFKKR